MGSSGERRAPRFRHGRSATTELAGLELALLDLFRQLDSANGYRRVVESFEPEHRPNPLFDSPVVLFNEVVQVLAPIGVSHFWKVRPPPSFPALRYTMRDRRPVRSSSAGAYSSSNCGERSLQRSRRDQEEIDRPSGLVHGPIQIDPSAANLYICLVHPPGSADGTSESPPALLEFRQVTLGPTQNRCVRQRDA
jgi:hypothetical protein